MNLVKIPCCMFPTGSINIFDINGILIQTEVMCGEPVSFRFQMSCAKHFYYLTSNMSKELIKFNKICTSKILFNKEYYSLYCHLLKNKPLWDFVYSNEKIDIDVLLYFDRIQKIWFDPKTGLGYSNNKVQFFRKDHMFHFIAA